MISRNRVTLLLAVAIVLSAVTAEGAKPRKRGGKRTVATESRADLQRQQKATLQEISDTKKKIKENDREVSRNLADLNRLQGDITATREKVDESKKQVSILSSRIGRLEGSIGQHEAALQKLRTEYLKAVKAIRAKKGSNSKLAYIFSAGSFAEARRRIRYLKEFSEWRKKQTAAIESQVRVLKGERVQLAQSKSQKDRALNAQLAAQRILEGQYSQKDALVVELRANGAALKEHLSRKQEEANALRGKVASLIAAEQAAIAKREAERRAREEVDRQARDRAERERQQALAQQRAREEEAQRQQAAKEEAARKEQQKKETARKEQARKEQARKETAHKEQTSKTTTKTEQKQTSGNNEYARARRRRPKTGQTSQQPKQTATQPKQTSTETRQASDFASSRGSLPRPVSGSFRVVSRFGRHSLPDMPDVTYDNPGIDVEVAKGAAAQAVYAGKVSGTYVVPGYGTVVIVGHGSYYTVYGNLTGASVKVGDTVRQGQTIGRVAEDEDNPGHGKIHFEVWKNRDKQDPMSWIR